MKERNCLYCGKEFPTNHGNRKYCSYQCYDENKKARNREKYAHLKLYEDTMHNDLILAQVYSEGFEVVAIKRLESLGFKHQHIAGMARINNKTFNITGRFAYTSYSDTELFIHKIKS